MRTVAVFLLVIVLSTVAVTPGAAAAVTPPTHPLELAATASAVTVERPAEQSWVELDLGSYMVAGRAPFEVRVTRRSYHDPLIARQVIRDRGRVRTKTLGTEIVRDFGGFVDFFHLMLTNVDGRTVFEGDQDFCPNGQTVRRRPDSPDRSPYPPWCPRNPFTLGSVWGISAGWGTSTLSSSKFQPVDVRDLPDGGYTARLSVNPKYRKVFGIPADVVTVQVTLRTVPAGAPPAQPFATAGGTKPTGPPTVPRGARPDLVALPAWNVRIFGDNPGTPEVEAERLTFAAAVWNAGPSPLVVDGFRRTGEPVMDSYQSFYDGKGRRVGYAPVGSMEWDSRDGHHHWHFRDFAGYRLLDGHMREVTPSQKEAFCLANTDAIDLFVENAVWQPDRTDLHSSCGVENSVTVRQVLHPGHADTYVNFVPGRAIDITDVPNGTYFIETVANPRHSLHEKSLDNNRSLRRIVISGSRGARTVHVPPYESIDTEARS